MPQPIYLIIHNSADNSEPIGYTLTEDTAKAICAEHNTQVFLSGGDMDSESYSFEKIEYLIPSQDNMRRDTASLYVVRLYSVQNTRLLKNRAPQCEWITSGCVFADVKPKVLSNLLLDQPTGLRCLEVIVPASTPEEAITKAMAIAEKLWEENYERR